MSKRKNVNLGTGTGTPLAGEPKTVATGDSFTAFGDAIRGHFNTAKGFYHRHYLTQQRELLDTIYRNSWISAKVCDAVAEDMVKDGVDFLGVDQDQETLLQKYLNQMQVWEGVADTIRWARLYGGCVAFINISGQDVSTPLDPYTISAGQFRGLIVVDRYRCDPIQTSAYQLEPEYYRIEGISDPVHVSRLIKMVGIRLPYFEALKENYWGDTVIGRVLDAVQNRDNALNASGKLINKSYLRTVKVKNLRQVLAAGGQAQKNLVKMFTQMRDLQENSGLTIIDTDDEFQTDSYTFTNLDGLLALFDQDVAAAADIPMTRLYGQSPAGFSTGDADLQAYYSRISSNQESMLRIPLTKLFSICYLSCFGVQPPADFGFSFRNVWQPSELEDRQQIVQECNTIISAANSGLIQPSTAMENLRGIGEKYGLFNTITDEEIQAAAPIGEPPAFDPSSGYTDPLGAEAEVEAGAGAGGLEGANVDTGVNVDTGASISPLQEGLEYA